MKRRARRFKVATAAAVAALCAAACAAAPRALVCPKEAARAIRLRVPFHPDAGFQCGPAALASVLEYWGDKSGPALLRREIYRRDLRGSLNVDLVLAAEDHGMRAEMYAGDLPRLKRELDAGRPLIALLDVGFRFYPLGHYVVIIGYDDALRGFYVHSGLERDRFWRYKAFDERWERMGRWTLEVLPRERS